MLLVRTYLSHSQIDGVGVFAAEPIQRGHLIWQLNPDFDVLLTEGDMAGWPAHMDEFLTHYTYRHRDIAGTWVLEIDNGRFMNHSSEPNTNFEEFYAGYALRDIDAGEELTCSYFDFDIEFTGEFMPRNSGSARQELRK